MTRLETKAKEFKKEYQDLYPKGNHYEKLCLDFQKISVGLLEGSNGAELLKFYSRFDAHLGRFETSELYADAFEVLNHLILYSPIASHSLLRHMGRDDEFRGRILEAAAFVLDKDASEEVKLNEELRHFLKAFNAVCCCAPPHFPCNL